jgi:hypothetical protein
MSIITEDPDHGIKVSFRQFQGVHHLVGEISEKLLRVRVRYMQREGISLFDNLRLINFHANSRQETHGFIRGRNGALLGVPE